MIYEDELKPWEINHVLTENDEYVKFAFESNETTSHDNIDDTEHTISSL